MWSEHLRNVDVYHITGGPGDGRLVSSEVLNKRTSCRHFPEKETQARANCDIFYTSELSASRVQLAFMLNGYFES